MAILGKRMSELAQQQALKDPLAKLNWISHAIRGKRRKTLQNHLANLKSAIRHVAGQKRLSGRGIALSPDVEVSL